MHLIKAAFVVALLALPIVALLYGGGLLIHQSWTMRAGETAGSFSHFETRDYSYSARRRVYENVRFHLSGDEEAFYVIPLMMFPRPWADTLSNSSDIEVVYNERPQRVRNYVGERMEEMNRAALQSVFGSSEEEREEYEAESSPLYKTYYFVVGLRVDGKTYFTPFYYRCLFTFYGLILIAIGLYLPVYFAIDMWHRRYRTTIPWTDKP